MESEPRALWGGQDGLVRVRILWEGLTVKCVEYICENFVGGVDSKVC